MTTDYRRKLPSDVLQQTYLHLPLETILRECSTNSMLRQTICDNDYFFKDYLREHYHIEHKFPDLSYKETAIEITAILKILFEKHYYINIPALNEWIQKIPLKILITEMDNLPDDTLGSMGDVYIYMAIGNDITDFYSQEYIDYIKSLNLKIEKDPGLVLDVTGGRHALNNFSNYGRKFYGNIFSILLNPTLYLVPSSFINKLDLNSNKVDDISIIELPYDSNLYDILPHFIEAGPYVNFYEWMMDDLASLNQHKYFEHIYPLQRKF